MRTVLTALVVAAAILVALPAAASADGGRSVGVEHRITGITYDLAGEYASYTCSVVHRTVVAGGFLERQSCELGPEAALPERSTVVRYGPFTWGSDYILRITGYEVWELALWWEQRFAPGGRVFITSFYER